MDINKDVNKRLPFDYEAEKAIIGCLLSYKDTIDIALNEINSDYFYVFYDEVSGHTEDNVDYITVRDKMLQKNIIEIEISNEFFVELVESSATIANIRDYCDIIRNKYMLRRLINICDEACVESRKDERDAKDILEVTEKKLFELQIYKGQKNYHLLKEIWPQIFDMITKAMATKDGITGVPTGFRELDNLTAGFQTSNFIVIAERPSMGKTSLALNMAYNMASKKNKKVIFFSLEMSDKELCMRLLASESHISSDKIRSGRLTNDDSDRIYDTARRINSDNLIIDDTSYLTISELQSKCRQIQSEKGLDIVMIDYLQLMHAGRDGY